VSRLVFIDTETTSLRPDRRTWEIGLYVRDAGYDPLKAHQWFIDSGDLDLANADPMALNIGGFYERHPQMRDASEKLPSEWVVLEEVERIIRGAHLVGAVTNFDAEVLGARMRDNGICPSWHYHLIDVEALAVGALAAKGLWPPGGGDERYALPWRSDEVSELLGVDLPSDEDRHTALGDARWARDVYDAVMKAGGE
jgi:DNA polymerase III epsilon subunit-like protein